MAGMATYVLFTVHTDTDDDNNDDDDDNLIFYSIDPSKATFPNSFHRGSRGCSMFVHQTMLLDWKMAHHGRDVCELCILLAKAFQAGVFCSRWNRLN
jgi:hypothetical protein